jgi:hypothetical protein
MNRTRRLLLKLCVFAGLLTILSTTNALSGTAKAESFLVCCDGLPHPYPCFCPSPGGSGIR